MTPHSVLYIDDEPDLRELLKLGLEAMGGFRCETAASGQEGLALAAADPPELILLDVMMPGLDGPDTLVRLRANPSTRSIPVVFITAKALPSELEDLGHLGVIGVVTKPFRIREVHQQLRAWLGDADRRG